VSIPKAIIVPARLQSVRFPRKLLQPVGGLPLVLHTARRIRAVFPEFPLFFAVGENELGEVLKADGFEAIATDPNLASGSDRAAAAHREIGAEIVVNVQADEPLVTRNQIETLFALIEEGAEMSTLGIRLTDPERFGNPNQVKIVCGADGRALYFSRAPVPWFRDEGGVPETGRLVKETVLGHLGLYGYRADFLDRFVAMEPTPLERIERLEQLRALENGARIQVGLTEEPSIGVDTPEDAERLERLLKNNERE